MQFDERTTRLQQHFFGMNQTWGNKKENEGTDQQRWEKDCWNCEAESPEFSMFFIIEKQNRKGWERGTKEDKLQNSRKNTNAKPWRK